MNKDDGPSSRDDDLGLQPKYHEMTHCVNGASAVLTMAEVQTVLSSAQLSAVVVATLPSMLEVATAKIRGARNAEQVVLFASAAFDEEAEHRPFFAAEEVVRRLAELLAVHVHAYCVMTAVIQQAVASVSLLQTRARLLASGRIDGDDLAQETVTRALAVRGKHAVQDTNEGMRLLLAILRNVAREMRRRAWRERSDSDDAGGVDEMGDEATQPEHCMASRVVAVLERLDDQDAKIIQAASDGALERASDTTRSKLCRARKRARLLLEREGLLDSAGRWL